MFGYKVFTNVSLAHYGLGCISVVGHTKMMQLTITQVGTFSRQGLLHLYCFLAQQQNSVFELHLSEPISILSNGNA